MYHMRLFLMLSCISLSMTLNAQYTDLPANITWTGPNVSTGTATVDEIETAYNYGRTQENTALSTNIPAIDFPDATVWATMNNNQRALWIINQERVARGILPLESTASEVIAVAQDYCQYLIDNETTGHYADGHNPLYRLQQDATISACMQAYNENIGYSYSNNSVAPTFVVERLIYWLIYEDASASWGHRQNFFKSNFNDDSGQTGKEGLLGVGYVVSTSYKTYNYTAFVVFNIIDPCATWQYPQTEVTQAFFDEKLSIKQSQFFLFDIAPLSIIEVSTVEGKVILKQTSTGTEYSSPKLSNGMYILNVQYPDSRSFASPIQIH